MGFTGFVYRTLIKHGRRDKYTLLRIAAHSADKIAYLWLTHAVAIVSLCLDVDFLQSELVSFDDTIDPAIAGFDLSRMIVEVYFHPTITVSPPSISVIFIATLLLGFGRSSSYSPATKSDFLAGTSEWKTLNVLPS